MDAVSVCYIVLNASVVWFKVVNCDFQIVMHTVAQTIAVCGLRARVFNIAVQ